jgi:hypothetical protein
LAAAVAAMVVSPALAQQEDRPGDRRGDRRGFRQRGDERPRFQRGGGRFGRFFQPAYLRRDLVIVTEELELAPSQRAIAETLLLDYETAFTEASEAMRDQFSQLRPQRAQDPERRAKRRALFDQMRKLREEIRARREQATDENPVPAEAIAELEQKMAALREEMIELRPQMPQGEELDQMMDAMRKIGLEWRRQRDALKTELETNLQSILTEDQMENWPDFERTLRRQKTLPQGRLSGESVDLILLLRDLDLDAKTSAALEPVVEEYTFALDRALAARNEALEPGWDEIFQAMRAGDVDRAVALAGDGSKLRISVRRVNEQYAETIAGVIAETASEELAEEFRSDYKRRAYPRIFRPTGTQRAFRTAKEIEYLEEEVLVAILALEETYLTELAAKNRLLVQATREYEPEQGQRWMRWGAARMAGERPQRVREEDPIREAFAERTELDQKYRNRLEDLLTPEQVGMLPQRRQQGEGRRGDRFGFGGAGAEERRARMLERFDTDGDGELSEQERDAMREQFRQWRRDREDSHP